jgi:hypothetical protein
MSDFENKRNNHHLADRLRSPLVTAFQQVFFSKANLPFFAVTMILSALPKFAVASALCTDQSSYGLDAAFKWRPLRRQHHVGTQFTIGKFSWTAHGCSGSLGSHRENAFRR